MNTNWSVIEPNSAPYPTCRLLSYVIIGTHSVPTHKHIIIDCTDVSLQSSKFLKIDLEMEWVDLWQLLFCLKPLWSGMGEVVPGRTSPTLHHPSPPTVL